MRTDYGWRGTVARILGALVLYIIAHANAEAFAALQRVAPSVDFGFVRISWTLLKVPVVLALVYLVWRIYPLYMRLLVCIGCLYQVGDPR